MSKHYAAAGKRSSAGSSDTALDTVRRLIRSGARLADAAADAGFSDQSHMTRHFKQAYGLSPGLWRSLMQAQPS